MCIGLHTLPPCLLFCGNYILHESEYDVHIFCVALDIIIYLAPVKSPFPGERGQGDRGSELEVCFKNILFLQTEPCIALMHGFYVIGCSFQRSAYPLRSFRHAVLQAIHSYCSRLLRPCREFLRFRC